MQVIVKSPGHRLKTTQVSSLRKQNHMMRRPAALEQQTSNRHYRCWPWALGPVVRSRVKLTQNYCKFLIHF